MEAAVVEFIEALAKARAVREAVGAEVAAEALVAIAEIAEMEGEHVMVAACRIVAAEC